MVSTRSRFAGLKILVVEDDTSICGLFKDFLTDCGFEVDTSGTAAEARAKVDTNTYDLITLDLTLPDADGLVLCADLKAKTGTAIVICSGSTNVRDKVLGLKLGADNYIVKPVDLDELLATIEAILRWYKKENIGVE